MKELTKLSLSIEIIDNTKIEFLVHKISEDFDDRWEEEGAIEVHKELKELK
jgi:hypothetical protein